MGMVQRLANYGHNQLQPKRRRIEHSRWPGWKVARMGKFAGFELINVGGGMEWVQASIGSILYTYHNSNFYEVRVKAGVQPNGWT